MPAGGFEKPKLSCCSFEVPGGKGFALVGYRESYTNGGKDLWFVRTSPSGDMTDKYHYGGNADDGGRALVLLEDGFALAGWTEEGGEGLQAWLLKVNPFGVVVWEQLLGPGIACDVVLSPDGGLIVVGEGADGDSDGLLIRFSESGVKHWTGAYGGSNMDELWTVFVEPEGNITFAGTYHKGDLTKKEEMWLVKLGLECGD